jgi:type II secretory pathway component PulF
VSAAALITASAALNQWTPARRRFHSLQLQIPVIGMLVRKAMIAQFAQAMSLLLRSGVAFVEALRLLQGSSRHLVLADELSRMEEAIRRGSDIAPTLEGSRIFPPLVTHIVAVGQNAGELTEMLTQLKEGYDTEVRLAVAKATAVLEPVLIVIMSAAVGFVVFATMMPILEATGAIQ